MAELRRGDRVVYEKLPRIRSARFCFVVLRLGEPDKMGREQWVVQMVDYQNLWGWISTTKHETLPACDLVPIEEYGARLLSVDPVRREFRLERFGEPLPGRPRFGADDDRFAGTIWDSPNLCASLRDDLFDIVRDRLCELERLRLRAA